MATKNRRTPSRNKTRSSSKSTRGSQKKSAPKARRPAPKKRAVSPANSPLVEARNSTIHGRGVYAILPIKKGARVIEYLGERISHGEADARYEKKGDDEGHTFR